MPFATALWQVTASATVACLGETTAVSGGLAGAGAAAVGAGFAACVAAPPRLWLVVTALCESDSLAVSLEREEPEPVGLASASDVT